MGAGVPTSLHCYEVKQDYIRTRMDLAQSFVSFLRAKFLGPVYANRRNSIFQLTKQNKYYVYSAVQNEKKKRRKKKEMRVNSHSHKGHKGRLSNPKKYQVSLGYSNYDRNSETRKGFSSQKQLSRRHGDLASLR